jgi:hypothetical protein
MEHAYWMSTFILQIIMIFLLAGIYIEVKKK